MSRYIMRLDDACEKMDVEKWGKMEELLDKYGILPLVGVIPHCEDPMMESYDIDPNFWKKVKKWDSKGWTIALHGYNHVYRTMCGGINPVNKRSEFAGEAIEIQREKIKKGVKIFLDYGFDIKVFFAPSHTFDKNTLKALKLESNISIISDTIAWDSYYKDGFYFVPQQSGKVRKLPFKTITFCYHPNTMNDKDFLLLESFLKKNRKKFYKLQEISFTNRKKGLIDKILEYLYFLRKR